MTCENKQKDKNNSGQKYEAVDQSTLLAVDLETSTTDTVKSHEHKLELFF